MKKILSLLFLSLLTTHAVTIASDSLAIDSGFSVMASISDATRIESGVIKEVLEYGLPVINITTENGEMPTVEFAASPEGCMGNGVKNATKIPGSVERYEPDGTLSYSSGDYVKKESGMTIKIRGNSSAYFDQKPYKIKLQKKADLLNRGDKNLNDKNWALLADSNWKQWLASNLMSNFTRGWSPVGEYVNVIFNGNYHGLYFLSETIEENVKARIKVDEDSGFVIEKDPYWWTEENDEYLTSRYHPKFNYTLKFPEYADLKEGQADYIAGVADELYTIVRSGDLEKNLDLDSWVDFVLVHDIMGTNDGAGCNVYYVKYDDTPESKIALGPAWDFDSSHTCTGWSKTHTWENCIKAIVSREEFFTLLSKRYNEIKDEVFDMMLRLSTEGPVTQRIWNTSFVATRKVTTPNMSSFDAAKRIHSNWFKERRFFLDEQFSHPTDGIDNIPCDSTDPSSRPTVKVVDETVALSGMIPRSPVKIFSSQGSLLFAGESDPAGDMNIPLKYRGIILIVTETATLKTIL